jgi:hypothetical protein
MFCMSCLIILNLFIYICFYFSLKVHNKVCNYLMYLTFLSYYKPKQMTVTPLLFYKHVNIFTTTHTWSMYRQTHKDINAPGGFFTVPWIQKINESRNVGSCRHFPLRVTCPLWRAGTTVPLPVSEWRNSAGLKANPPFILVDHFRVASLCFQLENVNFRHWREKAKAEAMFDFVHNALPCMLHNDRNIALTSDNNHKEKFNTGAFKLQFNV